jgi:hypothetical protein
VSRPVMLDEGIISSLDAPIATHTIKTRQQKTTPFGKQLMLNGGDHAPARSGATTGFVGTGRLRTTTLAPDEDQRYD